MSRQTPSRVHDTYKVMLLIDNSAKACRDRLSGILRRLSQRPDIRIIDASGLQTAQAGSVRADAVIIGDEFMHMKKAFMKETKFIPLESPLLMLDPAPVVRAAADLLLRRGHINFAFIGSNLPFETKRSAIRRRLFSSYLKSKGYPCHIYNAKPQSRTMAADELLALSDFIVNLPKPCGILLYADNRAPLVLDACRYAQVPVPEQVSLVGIDNDTSICENTQPTLSSVLPDFERAGYLIADILLKKLDGQKLEHGHLTYGVRTLFERDSSTDLRCGGLLVNRVDNYLKEHFTQKIKIGDIATHFNTSRRLIEMRFRKIRNCSIQKRIEELRLSQAKHMLAHSTIPVNEIAEACGYGTLRAFRYAFTAAIKVSPRQFRECHSFKRSKPDHSDTILPASARGTLHRPPAYFNNSRHSG